MLSLTRIKKTGHCKGGLILFVSGVLSEEFGGASVGKGANEKFRSNSDAVLIRERA